MNYLANGVGVFDSIGDLFYDLFIELGYGVTPDQYLYDQDTDMPIKYMDKFIKASVDNTPVYAGKNDIVFDPAKNYNLIACIFGNFLDKCVNSEDGDILGGYIANYIEDNETRDKQRVVVKTKERGLIESNFYYNIYLAYIDCIFKVTGTIVDLSNFDIIFVK